jgi:hypothetical protein
MLKMIFIVALFFVTQKLKHQYLSGLKVPLFKQAIINKVDGKKFINNSLKNSLSSDYLGSSTLNRRIHLSNNFIS